MTPEGRLRVEIEWDGHAAKTVAVRSSRPLGAIRIMEGKSLQQAVSTVPLLFGVCGRAQGVASVMAAEAALGVEVSEAVHTARMRMVVGEIIQEHLWRILVDWPARAGSGGRMHALAEMRRMLSEAVVSPFVSGDWNRIGGTRLAGGGERWPASLRALRDLLQQEVFGVDPVEWLEMGTCPELESWYEDADTVAARTLRDLARLGRFGSSDISFMRGIDTGRMHEVAEAMHDEEFARQPHWRGMPLETGALARQWQHPLVESLMTDQGNSAFVRFVARMTDLARLATDGGECMSGSQAIGAQAGFSWVETTRGALMHRVITDGERVSQYRIVAPTEWNFHPAGALAQGVSGMSAASAGEMRERVDWLVRLLDPCVGCEIDIRRA